MGVKSNLSFLLPLDLRCLNEVMGGGQGGPCFCLLAANTEGRNCSEQPHSWARGTLGNAVGPLHSLGGLWLWGPKSPQGGNNGEDLYKTRK